MTISISRVGRGLLTMALVCVAGLARTTQAETNAKGAVFSREEEPYRENGPANPRIQMVWTPADEEPEAIWSATLDGKDLRPVVSPSVLLSGGIVRVESPVRSPDGRYIACRGFTADDVQTRFLVDRKTRTVKTLMTDAWGEAEFNWSPDSRHLYFYGGGDMWDYDLAKGAQKKMPFIRASKLRLVDGGRRFLAALRAGVEYRDLNGKLISKKDLPKPAGGVAAISNSGERILYLDGETAFVVVPGAPAKRIVEFESMAHSSIFTANDAAVIFPRDGYLVRMDLSTRKSENLLPLAGHPMSGLTWINH